jgi:predicted solute-binding protein
MIVKKSDVMQEIVIDLTGPQGNAFVLLGIAKDFARQLDMNFKEIEDEMTSGDYENLVEVFDRYFGHFVILER